MLNIDGYEDRLTMLDRLAKAYPVPHGFLDPMRGDRIQTQWQLTSGRGRIPFALGWGKVMVKVLAGADFFTDWHVVGPLSADLLPQRICTADGPGSAAAQRSPAAAAFDGNDDRGLVPELRSEPGLHAPAGTRRGGFERGHCDPSGSGSRLSWPGASTAWVCLSACGAAPCAAADPRSAKNKRRPERPQQAERLPHYGARARTAKPVAISGSSSFTRFCGFDQDPSLRWLCPSPSATRWPASTPSARKASLLAAE